MLPNLHPRDLFRSGILGTAKGKDDNPNQVSAVPDGNVNLYSRSLMRDGAGL